MIATRMARQIPLALFSLLFLWSTPASIAAQHDLHISGFVDVSMVVPVDTSDNLAFSFDAVDVDIERHFAKGIMVRTDLDFFHGHHEVEVHINDSTTTHIEVPLLSEVEQAFVSFKMFNIKGVATPVVTFGKFNAPIGFELLDPPDMYQFSHSLVFDNALPTNLTGMSIAQRLAGGVDLIAYLVNGWDVNHNDDGKLVFGGRLGYEGLGWLATGLSFISTEIDTVSVIDWDATLTPIENLTVGLEFNQWLGVDTDTQAAMGWLAMINYAIGDFGITFRQDAWGKSSSTTFSPSYGIADGAGMLFEFRMDRKYDYDTEKTTNLNSAALEFTFSF